MNKKGPNFRIHRTWYPCLRYPAALWMPIPISAEARYLQIAQTGNMLLLGVHLSEGNIPAAIRYLCPVLAFTFGIALADIVRNSGIGSHLHWRQISVVAEAIILTIVSFLPQSHNLLANSLTSLACGIQVESFRKIHGNGIATTMCIGNLRSGTQNIYTFFQTKK